MSQQQYLKDQEDICKELYGDGTKKNLLLSEKQAKKLNYKALINGYIRLEINLMGVMAHQDIIDLCIKYAKILDIPPTDNPVNYISDQDLKKCDCYKFEGNKYYKSKRYDAAIIKYTTALRFNPNNHLVLNNRSLCYYLIKNYQDAEQDAVESITRSPTFYKAWHRYGTILEKQANYRLAGICYRTAYYLSVGWNFNKKRKNQYKSHYEKYMKNLEKTKQKDIINYINNFEIKRSSSNPEAQIENALSSFDDKEKMKEMMSKQGGMEQILMELMQNEEYLNGQQEEKIYSLIGESKYKYFIENNMLKCKFGVESWTISFASTPQIIENKRLFTIIVASSLQGKIIAQYSHYGVPNATDMLKYLYRTMAFANLTNVKQCKPAALTIDWRSRFMFDEIKKDVKKLGIVCIKETYQDSVAVCKPHNTDVNGWNHLD